MIFDEILHFLKDELLELLPKPIETVGQFPVDAHNEFESVHLSLPKYILQPIFWIQKDMFVLSHQFLRKLLIDDGFSCNGEATISQLPFLLVKLVDLDEVLTWTDLL